MPFPYDDLQTEGKIMSKLTKYLFIGVCYTVAPCLFAHDAGPNADSLDRAIKAANAGIDEDTTLNFTQDVSLSSNGHPAQVRPLNSDPNFVFVGKDIVIKGNHFKLDGNQNARGLFIGGKNSKDTGSVTIKDLIFKGTKAKGGDGKSSGGGGLGAGGGLFVGKNTVVTLENCSFVDCSAIGGLGAAKDPILSSSSGGGGGMGGDGGTGAFNAGGGGGGFGGRGGAASVGAAADGGGSNGFFGDHAIEEAHHKNFDGEENSSDFGSGGDGSMTTVGGNGGFGGGGGGSPHGGGRGGFGGGGGGGVSEGKHGGPGGMGGFGAGGGGANHEDGGKGGFAGGNGNSTSQGGNGAGLGGAIFIETGGDLTIKESITFENNSGSLGQDIFMMSEGSITFDLSKSAVLKNPIRGNIGRIADGIPHTDTTLGGLIKEGPALLQLTGEHTYTGRTVVKEGELRVEGSLLNTVRVKEGATLSGDFKIKATPSPELMPPSNNDGDLINSGIVSPGLNGTGTIEVSGTFVNNPTGVLRIDIAPNAKINNDSIKVGKRAVIDGGTLELFLHPGNYIAGTEYLIIDGASTGSFDAIEGKGPLAGQLDFDISYGSVIATVLNNRIFQDQMITADPAVRVSRCVSNANIAPGSDFAIVVQDLGTLSDGAVNKALIDISPIQYGALEWINERNNSYVASLLSQHQFELCCSPRDCCSCTCRANVWVNVFGNFMDNHKRLNHLRRYDANAVGVLAGMDYCINPCNYIGASAGYTKTYLHWKNHHGKGDTESYYGALYGIFKGNYFNVDLSFIGGATDYDFTRHMVFGTTNRKAHGDFWGWFLTSHLGAQGNCEWSCFNLEPFALVDYHYWRREGFREHGANSLNLRVRAKTQNMLRAEAGVRGYYSIMCCCSCFAPYIGLSYVGEFPLHKSKQRATFVDQTCLINVTSYDDCVNTASPELGVKWTHCDGFSFVAGYKGLFNAKTCINQVEGRLEWVF